jgi:hypothetical protein
MDMGLVIVICDCVAVGTMWLFGCVSIYLHENSNQSTCMHAIIAGGYAMLCYAMICYAVLCYAMLCCAMLCYAMQCYAMLCYAVLCYAMLYYAMQCYAMI